MKEALYYKLVGNQFFVKAVGHITAALCSGLRDSVLQIIQSPEEKSEFFVDLSECDYMDSTFMGLLVRFNKDFKTKWTNTLIILNPSPESEKLLKGLGLNKVLVLQNNPSLVLDTQSMTEVGSEKMIQTSLVLEAHVELSDVSEENQQKFSTLNNLLRIQMENEKK